MSETVKTVIEIVALIIGLAGIGGVLYKISSFAKKIKEVSGKIAVSGESVVPILKALGMEELAVAVDEGADVPNAVNKLAALCEEFTADGRLTAAEIIKLFEAGKGVWIEAKDFRIKVFPKKP